MSSGPLRNSAETWEEENRRLKASLEEMEKELSGYDELKHAKGSETVADVFYIVACLVLVTGALSIIPTCGDVVPDVEQQRHAEREEQ